MFVGSVERGCRTLAVGAMELAWVLIGGEATNCSYRSPPYCTSTEGRRVHCMIVQQWKGGLAIAGVLHQASLSGGKWFWARSGAEKSLQLQQRSV